MLRQCSLCESVALCVTVCVANGALPFSTRCFIVSSCVNVCRSGPKTEVIVAEEATLRLRRLEGLFQKLTAQRAILASVERLYQLPVL